MPALMRLDVASTMWHAAGMWLLVTQFFTIELLHLAMLCSEARWSPESCQQRFQSLLWKVLYDEPTGRLALVFELMNMNMYEAFLKAVVCTHAHVV
eukprot:2789751-Amphidinium_carterae.3